jgi:two-component system sensor histidine kinase/response regulator
MQNKQMKVLIIEDSSYFRKMIKIIIKNHVQNIQLFEASNGKAGVKLALEHLPDLIISDIIMPELDGYGVLKALRQNPNTQAIPFIFLSSRVEKSDQRYGMDLGADDYLTKPFTREELLGAIAARMKKKELIQQQSQKQLDELRDNLTHSLPHELHTPLTGILGLSRVILDAYELEDPRVVQMIQTIHDSAQSLYRLTQNFLLYADLEMSSRDPDRLDAVMTFSDITFTKEMIEKVAYEKAENFHRLKDLHLNLNQDESVRISAQKLEKILEEVIDNAFKFSEPETPIHINSYANDLELTIEIMDSGKGMSPDEIESIGAYVQFQRKLYEQQGSGLGLIIAKRLTELYGGSFSMISIPHQQTMVKICLPRK